MSDKKAFQVGDKVTCILWGKGVVEKVLDREPLLLRVRFFDDDFKYYTSDGKLCESSAHSTLYHGHGTFNIELIEDKKPEIKYQWLIKTLYGKMIVTDDFYTKEEVESAYIYRAYEIIKPIEETKITE